MYYFCALFFSRGLLLCIVNVTVPRVKVLLISNVLFWTLEL